MEYVRLGSDAYAVYWRDAAVAGVVDWCPIRDRYVFRPSGGSAFTEQQLGDLSVFVAKMIRLSSSAA